MGARGAIAVVAVVAVVAAVMVVVMVIGWWGSANSQMEDCRRDTSTGSKLATERQSWQTRWSSWPRRDRTLLCAAIAGSASIAEPTVCGVAR
jgi:nitrogen fixation-related uncharacterized protein